MPIRLLDQRIRCVSQAAIESRPESMAMVEQSQQHHYLQGTADAFFLHSQDHDLCEVRRHLFQEYPMHARAHTLPKQTPACFSRGGAANGEAGVDKRHGLWQRNHNRLPTTTTT